MLLWHFLNCALWTGRLFAFNLGYFFHNVWIPSGHLPLEIVAICTSCWDGLFSLCLLLPARLAFAMPMLLSGLLLLVLAALASGSTGGGDTLIPLYRLAPLESSPLFHLLLGFWVAQDIFGDFVTSILQHSFSSITTIVSLPDVPNVPDMKQSNSVPAHLPCHHRVL